MRRLVLIGFALALAGPVCAARAHQVSGDSIAVKFVIDGQPVACNDLKVELSLGGKRVIPVALPGGFLVPKQILDAYSSKTLRSQNNLSAKVTCDERTVSASDLYPVRLLPGQWEVGIAFPTTWFDSPARAPEQGTWISYIVTDCNGCDPGIVVSEVHYDVPAIEDFKLRSEQGKGAERERDVAYALAVFGSEYQANRDRLVKILGDCLKRLPNSSEDEVCNERLVQYIANLYWRGDDEVLHILFNIAQQREDFLDGAGQFYADLLDRRPDVATTELSSIPAAKQSIVCAMAFSNDLRFDDRKRARVESKLRATGTEFATRCLDALRNSEPEHFLPNGLRPDSCRRILQDRDIAESRTVLSISR